MHSKLTEHIINTDSFHSASLKRGCWLIYAKNNFYNCTSIEYYGENSYKQGTDLLKIKGSSNMFPFSKEVLRGIYTIAEIKDSHLYPLFK